MRRITGIAATWVIVSAITLCARAQSAREMVGAAGVKGGLIVHVGCGDGKLTAALRVNDRCLVHGLDARAENVAAAREHIRSLGIYGAVSVEGFGGRRLPYTDNMVNLVVCEDPGVPAGEIARVLAPGGTAYVRKGREWGKTEKPRPGDIDEWTHFLHDAGNNAVARDGQVGPPRRIQWLAGPKRSRDHDSLASLSAMTSAGGRIFYIYDEGPTSLIHRPARWKLVARDAFNGALLWKRDIDSWITHLYYFRSGPVWLARRLVSTNGRVYATLGLEAPVTALDAATGRTLRTYAGSEKAEEILSHKGVLLVAVGDPEFMNKQAKQVWAYWEYTLEGEPKIARSVRAYRAGTGEPLWKKDGNDLAYLLPLSLAAAGKSAFYMDNKHLHCVELETGRQRWRAAFATKGLFLRNYAPTVVATDDVVLCLTMDRLAAFSIEDGRKLWETKGYKGFASPGDLFVIDGLAWTLPVTATVRMDRKDVLGDGGTRFLGIDVHSGQVKRSFAKADVWPGGHHHRCYRNKASQRYLITGRRGLEFVDLKGDRHVTNWWVRGECQYGVMPCNGLIYAPPDPCRCFNFVKVDGFCALAARSSLDGPARKEADRLARGPAYAAAQKRPKAEAPPAAERKPKAAGLVWQPPPGPRSGEWPTFRHDVTRSGATPSGVPAALQSKWARDVGGKLSSAVAAAGRLMISSIDRHTVHCLDAETGKAIWRFTAGGRVDSPPTIFAGLAIFGSRDGCVYAIRAEDGQLAWRFRAAPADRRVLVDGRLESVWPVHGSVLVLGPSTGSGQGVVYFAAGRSSYLDGGIRLYGLDAASGAKLHEAVASASPAEPTRKGFDEKMTPALPDVLVSDGESINMRQVVFDRALNRRPAAGLDTLFTVTGLLEDCWAHRHNWSLGSRAAIRIQRHNGAFRGGPGNPFGKLIVFDGGCAYAVQSLYTFLKHSPGMWPSAHKGHLHQKYATYEPGEFPVGVRLYAQENRPLPAGRDPQGRKKRRGKPFTSTVSHKWGAEVPLQVRAMVLAGGTIFAAGWMDSVGALGKADAAGEDARTAVLWALSSEDGKKLGARKLDSLPVFDGMIAAYGRLYMATTDGKVVCFAGHER